MRGWGAVVYQDNAHLHGPLGLVLVPNGDLITANGDGVNPDPNQPSELVEFTPSGQFVGQFSIDPNPDGPFGLAVTNAGGVLRLAAVDDNTNSLDVWTFKTRNSRSSFASNRSWASGQSAAIDHLFSVTQESDVPSTLFSRRRVMWGQS